MDPLAEAFPPFGLRLRSGDLELRVMRDEDMPLLMALKRDGIVEPDLPMPFLHRWHEGPDVDSLAFYWTERSKWSHDYWNAMFVVRRAGEVCGVQDLHNNNDVRHTQSLSTGSWVARRFHRQGIATRMRRLVATFAFDELGVTELNSGIIEGNAASLAVSTKLGYVANGARRVARDESYVVERKLVLTPEGFVRGDEPCEFEGVEEFKAFVGLA